MLFRSGWRWLKGRDQSPQLLLFLGPPPLTIDPINDQAGRPPAPPQLRLSVRPAAMDTLGLLPEDMPVLTRRADQIWFRAEPLDPRRPDDPITRLTGRLELKR